ncbi:hypothetical protein KP509_22G012300 [Ceratopteris richardii]|uniref:VLIG-type G domain-containing protein n=1 Tax=Ceratopteris richardii TaxID=49495 RepID=A0A8T2S4U2_CERRI|nr:hypothetical protein KP509_22G012300 [Ceratopteris richardii]
MGDPTVFYLGRSQLLNCLEPAFAFLLVFIERPFSEAILKSLLQATDTTIHGSASQSRFNLICARKYLDCLRHRVDSLNHEVKLPPKSTSHDDGYGTEPEDDEIYCQTPMENLMQIIQASDLPTQVAVCNLLLSQRSAFPFVFPVRTNEHQKTKKASDDEDVHSSVSSQGGQSSLRDHCKGENASDAYLFEYTQALSFVDVKLQNERKLCFADDVCLPRVVFVSDRKDGQSHSSIIASRVVQCNFMSQQLHCMMSTERCGIRDFTIIEVGAGFIKTDSSRYIECICINVFGAYENIIHFISQLGAEMLVVEIESANADKQITRLDTVCSELVRWRETGGKPGVNREAKLIWGSETYLVERITKIVYSKFKRSESSQNERYSLSEICSRHFQQGCTHAEATNEMRNCLRQMLEACDFKEMRKQLKLQDRFAYDPEELLPGLQIKEGNNNQEPNSQLREKRELRMAGIMVLARGLYQMSSHALKDASAEVDRLHKECQKSTSRRAYYEAKHEYEKKHVGLENLWRELSIIYRADPVNQHRIPRLAAQHLLDGSPLEIIDGDAGVFSKFWVENVLQQLQTMASKSREKPARIFVMSVIGVQSSGKSTLLNLMFGTQLQTSAGRCTRGVYAQLVPSHREQYDYVLLLDIEGLRSPEFFQLDSNSSIVRDNCLATFGFLPSDVSVFMVSNEDDIGLREILPMVLLAFKGSEIAEKYGQKIRSKIVFVYRSIDTNDQGKIKGSKQKLSRYLKDAAREVGNLKGRLDCGTEDGEAPNYRRPGEEQNQPESPFEDSEVGLRLDFTSDDRYSDIKFFGNLKRGSNPPTDTPEWDYGENVLHLREYLHERVVDDKWEASTFEEWFKRLTMVWDCILTSNFEISFRTQMQYASYLELHEKMNLIKSKVSEMYCEDFKSFEMMVLGAPENASDIHYDASVRSLKLRDFVESQRQEVAKLFHTNKTYNEWKASVLAQWDLFCSQTDHWYQKRVDDLVNGEVKFKQVIEKYQLKCKEEIVNNYDARIWGTEQINSEQMRERFEKLFEEIIRSAESEYRPISANIDKQISDYYKNKHLGDVLDSDRRSFSFFRSSKTVFDERLRQRLDFMIQDELKFEKQYSAPAVDRVIQRTKQILSEAGSKLGKDAKLSGHRWVYKKLIDAMTKIQNRWDEDHNVSKKLQSDEIKEGLQRFFEDVSQGLENSILLANQLERVLKTELKNTFELAVVKRVLRLISFSTLTNQDVIRKVLDYHLLRLCELKQDELVVSFVTLGSKHFTYMLERLVSHQMSETLMKQLWDNLVESLVQCLKEPPNGPTTDDGFISTLSFRLTEVIQDITGGDISLPIALRSIYVRNDHERTTDLSATDFYSKKLPKLCESLQQEPMPNVKDHLVGKVMKEVEVAVDESWRSRCGIRCPGCGSPCHLAKGHNDQKHDTIHQPAGLNGMRWKDEDTLVERSCSTMVNDEQILWYRGGSRPPIPYSDFCIHFPEWSKPMGIENNNFSKQVREFVFFNYQDQLVHWFMRGASGRTFQQAKNIPASYNHNPKELQDKLELLLRRNFAKKEDFNTFMDVLLS